jgi:diguanylate cyclase (GGDEF)-like protein
MSALTMRILFVAVQSRDAATARQAVLAQTATRLLRATDTASLAATSWQAQQELLRGYRAEGFLLDEHDDEFIVNAAPGTAGTGGCRIQHADVASALRSPDREPVILREPGTNLARLAPQARWWYLIPTAADDAVLRILVLACTDHLPQDLVGSSQVLMRQSALAFNALTHREELHRQASHDALTGLPNHKEFVQRLTDCSSGSAGMTAVLFIDLDGFKAVNDRHGHLAGDELLNIVARRLGAAAGPHSTVARLGGDEFAILVPDLAATSDAYALSERLEVALMEPALLNCGTTVTVGASIGVHVACRPYDAAQVLQTADSAMYRVKAEHRTARTTPPSPSAAFRLESGHVPADHR